MKGPPGSGKTLLARSLPSILPRLTLEEALDVTRIYSVADMLRSTVTGDAPLNRHRPFRAPHHTISHAGLVGGGQWPRPGEIASRTAARCFSTNCLNSGRTPSK